MTSQQDFSVSVIVDASPQQAFDAILNPRAWWGDDIEGDPATIGAEWTYRYKDLHRSRQRTTELVPGQRVGWSVVEASMSFLKDRTEWVGMTILFDIAPAGEKTEIRLTHAGLRPAVECFDICSDAWTGLVRGSLKTLIETGTGDPDSVEKRAA